MIYSISACWLFAVCMQCCISVSLGGRMRERYSWCSAVVKKKWEGHSMQHIKLCISQCSVNRCIHTGIRLISGWYRASAHPNKCLYWGRHWCSNCNDNWSPFKTRHSASSRYGELQHNTGPHTTLEMGSLYFYTSQFISCPANPHSLGKYSLQYNCLF